MSSRRTTRSTARSGPVGDVPPVSGYGPKASIPAIGLEPDPDAIIRQSRRRQTTTTKTTVSTRLRDEELTHPSGISFLSFQSDGVGNTSLDPDMAEEDDDVERDLVMLSFMDFVRWVEEVETGEETGEQTATGEEVETVGEIQTYEEAEATNSSIHKSQRMSSDSTPSNNPSSDLEHQTDLEPSSQPRPTSGQDVPNSLQTISQSHQQIQREFPPSLHRSNENENSPRVDTDTDSGTDVHTDGEEESESGDDPWGDDIPDVIITAPRSDDEASTRYTAIKNNLEEFLSTKFESYFFAPVVVTPRDGHDIPVLVILLQDSDSNPLPTPAELESQVGGYFVLVLGKGNFDSVSSTTADHAGRNYHRLLMCGDSIEVTQGEHGTLGLFVEEEDRLVGITAGHLLKGSADGSDVMQPSLSDFKQHVEETKRSLHTIKQLIAMTKRQPNDVETLRQEQETIESELAGLMALIGKDDTETRKNLLAGHTIAWELRSVKFKGRRCYSDWGKIKVLKEREPSQRPFVGSPSSEETVLYGMEWENVADWGDLDFDLVVRKSGRRTGLTFGFVAGVHAGWVNPKVKSAPCSEYYVLQELHDSENFFAKKGDSGAAVVASDGKVVGFVHCGIEIKDVQVVCLPGGDVPDILTIASRRDSAGDVDTNRQWFSYFNRRSFILIESAVMVKERAGLAGKIFPNN